MATAILKYDMSDPDDRMSLERAMRSLDMASFIFEVLLNGKKRFRDLEGTDEIWAYLHEEAANHNINIETLIV
jgi:hypothetical protein